jgi:DNA-binding transcriptional regulator LsrR (DeoR family)
MRFGRHEKDGASFDFPVMQMHLADALGLTPVHVNRCLKGLRESGVATIASGMVHIHAWNQLAASGDFDRAYLQAENKPEQPVRLVAVA